ncbi:NADPH:quinone oxidoreductase family protein [Polymorphobacter sp.]|uniref:NADPH:quinone oxidoreductase family protein n=1 Tax=Polymorphobacter sp. TaxID=1909290 RepID=UPI003F71E41A
MKAVVCVEHGPPEQLVVQDIPMPEPGPGHVRVRVHAAGVNFPDTLIIRNLYQFKPALPFTVGAEAAGIVDALGEGTGGLTIGDRVVVMTGHGCFAEHLVADRTHMVPIPADMPMDIAAGFTMTYGTSLHALKQRARLMPGETLLVLGAAGGVGLTAVELGKLMGARVIAAASSDEKLALARAMGADETINYASEDFKARIKMLTDGRGVDVVYDPVGDRYAEPAFRGIGWGGRYLVVGFAGGMIPSLPLNLPLIKGASIVGVFWGAFTQAEPEAHAANMAELMAWFRAGKLKPHVSNRFALEDGPAAIRWMMDRKAMGKVILTIADN